MPLLRLRVRLAAFVCGALIAAVVPARAIPDSRFDNVTFCCPCSPDDHLCQAHFDELNLPTTNGHYIAMGTDAHRLDLATNGNALAIYFNTFNDGWTTNTGAMSASNINQYAIANFTSNGPRPDWIVLNEISSGLWTSDPNYRAWVQAAVHSLKTTYGFNVILFSPFPNPGANGVDWQAIANDAFIGIENYLSGEEVRAQGYSINYCQSQYQSSITSYAGLGVNRARLMLGEHFAQTTSGTTFGRAGVASNEWDMVITARNQGALNAGFAGFLSYAWSKNAMLVSDQEELHFEDTYRTNQLPVNSGVTAPFVVLQPQSQTVPIGGNVSFLVFRAGTAPTTYQWQMDGTNLLGATSSSLNLTNLQITNAGNYGVILSNTAGTTLSSNAFLSVRVPDPIVYEPFAPAQTSYSPGANLIGQTNAAGQWWSGAGPPGVQPTIQAGSLVYGGLDGPVGNSVKFGSNGLSARLNLGTNATNGSMYYSLVVRLTDISTLNSGGVFWAGFNNSAGTQGTTPNTVGTRLLTRLATGGFNVGLDKSSGNANGFVFSPTVYTTNDTIFVVGSYTFNAATNNDDLSRLWIDPTAASLGQASAPAPTLVCTATNDINAIESFVLFNRSASEPAEIVADEIRVGNSWASVTAPAENAGLPALSISRSGNTSVLSWPTSSPGFVLQSNPTLAASNAWSDLGTPVYPTIDKFFATNVSTSTNAFYRLREPQ
jgi:hypothetical protein